MTGDLFRPAIQPPRPVVAALTLHQPWASLMAWGVKTIETRGWLVRDRGPLAIHAASRTADRFEEICRVVDPIAKALHARDMKPDELPRGVVLCVVDLVDCRIVIPNDPFDWASQEERLLGDFRVGRVGWITNNLRVLEEPIPQRGYQRTWPWRVPEGVKIEGLAE